MNFIILSYARVPTTRTESNYTRKYGYTYLDFCGENLISTTMHIHSTNSLHI